MITTVRSFVRSLVYARTDAPRPATCPGWCPCGLDVGLDLLEQDPEPGCPDCTRPADAAPGEWVCDPDRPGCPLHAVPEQTREACTCSVPLGLLLGDVVCPVHPENVR